MCSTICYSCESTCESQNLLPCKSGHSMCETCSEVYLNMCISEPDLNVPMKCKCSDSYDFEAIKRMVILFKIEDKIDYLLVKSSLTTENNEVIIECPFCEYIEIRDVLGINFIFCKNQNCNKITCYYCHLECSSEDEAMMIVHFECALNERIKSQINEAIENGSTVNCPNCNRGGRKEEEDCTYMTCIKCNNKFCYVCGLEIKNFKDFDERYDDSENFSFHNNEWRTNDHNCPMYFNNEIHDHDDRWPESDYESVLLDFFHRKKILKNLRDFIELEGENLIKEFESKYKWLEKADLTINQILNEDLVLIKRKNYDDDEE